jgi:tryptophan-rich sensory protein
MPLIISAYTGVDPTSALLLLPYLGWLTFATFLNQAICKLNPMDSNGYNNAMIQKEAAEKAEL